VHTKHQVSFTKYIDTVVVYIHKRAALALITVR